MSRDVITVGSTMWISLLYRGEYSQWSERFMNYLEEQTDGEAMINSIKNGEQLLPVMRSSEYGEQDRKATILYEYETFKATEGEQFLDTYLRYLQVINDLKKCGYKKDNCELNYKFLMDINTDALYNILKQNQGDVNDVMGYKKKAVVVSSYPLALVAEKTKKEDKKADEKKRDMSKVKCYKRKKEGHFSKDGDEQVLLAEDQAWIESSSDSDQKISANMVFMTKMEKVLSDSEESSSYAKETITEVSYYTSDSEREPEYETLEYYDNSTNYGLFVNNDDDQEHDAIESASENFNENHIVSQTDHDESEVDHNDSEEKDHLVDKLIKKFNKKIAKCQKRIEKANQQSKDLKNQNKDLQDKYDVVKNKLNTFEEKNNEVNKQIKVLNEKNDDFLAQMEVLQEQLKVKHVVIDTHTECQAQYAKLEEEKYQHMIRYSPLCDNDKQNRRKIDKQEILFDKMSRQLVEINNVLRLQEKILEKEKFRIWVELAQDFSQVHQDPKHQSKDKCLDWEVREARKIAQWRGTDISQKDEKPSKKRQNRTRDGKVCEDEANQSLVKLRRQSKKI
ncbi:hypothetical protein Tco_0874099 [Tanacetum coccineum]|uniref:DUF4219 domain-containing protein n=1 Tax=Tanacetum coccineum TaxID=301880 RepID=A0ABQ5BPB7_9ASTR